MFRKAAFLFGLISAATPAFANEAPQPAPTEPTTNEAGSTIYPPDFFAQYAPQNALDMVARVPGFSVRGGDDRRGFGAGGNVLIDGERPSSKSQGLRSILSRIPAGNVERLELIRGASGTDASGQGLILNVVRRDGGGQGLYEVSLEHTENGRISPRGEASYAGSFGSTEFTLGVDRYLEMRPQAGGRILRDARNNLTGTRYDDTPRTYRETEVNASLETPAFGGTLRLNAQGGRWRFATDLESTGFTAAGARRDDFTLSIEDRERGREFGGDWERDLGPITLKLVGLDRAHRFASDQSTTNRDANRRFTERTEQFNRTLKTERIGRITLSGSPSSTLDLEAGFETAYNSLDQALRLSEDSGAGSVAIALPSASVLVEEDRSEAFARSVWRPAPAWTVEAALNVETSTLTQSGDTTQSTELTYWKPSLQVSRTFGERNQLRLRVYRDVSQLDFGDFVSVSELNDDRVAAGNPDLRPQADWRVDGKLELRWAERGAMTLEVSRRFIEDASDSVPVGGFDAPGNIGDADVLEIDLETQFPLDGFMPNALLEIQAGWTKTEVTDPVTRLTRSLSGFSDTWWEVEFSQELPQHRLSWGASMFAQSENEQFRVAERETFEETGWLSAYLETTAIDGVKLRFWGENLLNFEVQRERRFFTPNRNGSFVRSEQRQRQFGPLFGVTLSGTF
ncbi:MAG: outer membrane beta-barrel protein [Caulobacterales bacterium]